MTSVLSWSNKVLLDPICSQLLPVYKEHSFSLPVIAVWESGFHSS